MTDDITKAVVRHRFGLFCSVVEPPMAQCVSAICRRRDKPGHGLNLPGHCTTTHQLSSPRATESAWSSQGRKVSWPVCGDCHGGQWLQESQELPDRENQPPCQTVQPGQPSHDGAMSDVRGRWCSCRSRSPRPRYAVRPDEHHMPAGTGQHPRPAARLASPRLRKLWLPVAIRSPHRQCGQGQRGHRQRGLNRARTGQPPRTCSSHRSPACIRPAVAYSAAGWLPDGSSSADFGSSILTSSHCSVWSLPR